MKVNPAHAAQSRSLVSNANQQNALDKPKQEANGLKQPNTGQDQVQLSEKAQALKQAMAKNTAINQ